MKPHTIPSIFLGLDIIQESLIDWDGSEIIYTQKPGCILLAQKPIWVFTLAGFLKSFCLKCSKMAPALDSRWEEQPVSPLVLAVTQQSMAKTSQTCVVARNAIHSWHYTNDSCRAYWKLWQKFCTKFWKITSIFNNTILSVHLSIFGKFSFVCWKSFVAKKCSSIIETHTHTHTYVYLHTQIYTFKMYCLFAWQFSHFLICEVAIWVTQAFSQKYSLIQFCIKILNSVLFVRGD